MRMSIPINQKRAAPGQSSTLWSSSSAWRFNGHTVYRWYTHCVSVYYLYIYRYYHIYYVYIYIYITLGSPCASKSCLLGAVASKLSTISASVQGRRQHQWIWPKFCISVSKLLINHISHIIIYIHIDLLITGYIIYIHIYNWGYSISIGCVVYIILYIYIEREIWIFHMHYTWLGYHMVIAHLLSRMHTHVVRAVDMSTCSTWPASKRKPSQSSSWDMISSSG